MALTLASAARLLSEHGLLREIIQGDAWTLDAQTVNGFDKPFGSITYDTRQVVSDTLLCCKGRFKAEYLNGIDDRGLAAPALTGEKDQFSRFYGKRAVPKAGLRLPLIGVRHMVEGDHGSTPLQQIPPTHRARNSKVTAAS